MNYHVLAGIAKAWRYILIFTKQLSKLLESFLAGVPHLKCDHDILGETLVLNAPLLQEGS
jgi:hypothetical protein